MLFFYDVCSKILKNRELNLQTLSTNLNTREFGLMIQLGRVLGGVGGLGHIPTVYIQLAGAGSKTKSAKINV